MVVPETSCLLCPVDKLALPGMSLYEPKEGHEASEGWVQNNSNDDTARRFISACVKPWSSQQTNLQVPQPMPTPTPKKKKLLFWHHWPERIPSTVHTLLEWRVFCLFLRGILNHRQKCIRAAEKIHLYKLAPLLWNFQLYISNYGCQLMDSEKTFWSPPSFFLSFRHLFC